MTIYTFDTILSSMKDKAIVYVIQEIPGTREGRPKINIMGAQKFGDIKVLLEPINSVSNSTLN